MLISSLECIAVPVSLAAAAGWTTALCMGSPQSLVMRISTSTVSPISKLTYELLHSCRCRKTPVVLQNFSSVHSVTRVPGSNHRCSPLRRTWSRAVNEGLRFGKFLQCPEKFLTTGCFYELSPINLV